MGNKCRTTYEYADNYVEGFIGKPFFNAYEPENMIYFRLLKEISGKRSVLKKVRLSVRSVVEEDTSFDNIVVKFMIP